MALQYQAIIIGAGLGGLSAAASLARNGLKVLVLERHNVPGGYASSFVRGRYEFEVALHELSGIGTEESRGELFEYLEQVGVASKLEFTQVKELYRAIYPDLDLILPLGVREYEDTLCQAFPHCASGIRQFLARVKTVAHETAQFVKQQGIGNPLTAVYRYANTIRYLPATWGSVLERDVKDPKARAVISQDWGYFGMGPSKISFLYFALGLYSYMRLGPWYVRGRSHSLSNAFVQTIEEYGGEVRCNCSVTKIKHENGTVNGVVTQTGEEISADWVISNADPVTTSLNLIGQDAIPASFFTTLRHHTVAPSSFNVYLGIAKSLPELGITTHENFIHRHYDHDRHYEQTKKLEPPSLVLLTCYNTVYPAISPPGTSIIVLTALFYGQPWLQIRPHDYLTVKTRIADSMLNMAEQVVPDLRTYAEVVDVATPLTNLRYTRAMGGSIYGFNNYAFDHTILRMSPRGPLKRLCFVGAWTQPGGGFEPCMMSGKMVGELIARKVNSPGEIDTDE